MFSFLFLYGIIVLVLLVGAFFIVYHILRYSLSEALGYFGAIFFGSVLLVLLFINFISFQALDTESVVPEIDLGTVLPTDATPSITPTRNSW